MSRIIGLVALSWLPLLGGCAMMGGMSAMHAPASGPEHASLQHATASTSNLEIRLAFPSPTSGATVRFDARIRTVADSRAVTGADVRLQVHNPEGRVAEVTMRPSDDPGTGTYQALYAFSAAGSYTITAEARAGTGSALRAVSVSTTADISEPMHVGRRSWLPRGALLAGVGMAVMMALMIGGRVI